MKTNVGAVDRVFRMVLGFIMLAAPFASGLSIFDSGAAIMVCVIAGIILVATSVMKICPLYRIVGFRTRRA